MIRFCLLFALITASLNAMATSSDSSINIYPAPAEEVLYEGYTVLINGQHAPVYQARVSAFPINQRWPGY